MGQKTHPRGLRLGIIQTWDAQWFPKRKSDYAEWLQEDIEIEKFIRQRMARAAIARVRVERWDEERFKIHVHTARPGMVIGRRGADIELLQEELAKKIGKPSKIEIKEIRQPDLEAYLVAEGVAAQLERRARYRDAMKRAVQNSMRSGAQGCKIMVSGRLGGNEIANSHYEIQGRVPLHTLRADIDYGFAEAKTTYGVIGVKAWIFRGEVISGFVGQDDLQMLKPRSGLNSPPRGTRGNQDRGRGRVGFGRQGRSR